ncbi:helix-turn-helix domain-containing protein [Marinitoga lauensis]|uniref:helix-turn-helix domain-containing protein n=1 Tax=Marinitoga lauensis TaxID=2201189 RepID=UPI001013C245|nr:helix-turn-helix transcriptional regulator [Marinitoga lauensis]
MTFGERLKELRKLKKITQKELATKCETSQSLISEYEKNLKQPTAEMIKKIAIVLDVSADYLLGLSDIPTLNNEIPEYLSKELQKLNIIKEEDISKQLKNIAKKIIELAELLDR